LLPTAALAWRPADDWLVYARYHEGYRPGSQRIIGEGAQLEITRFEPDELKTGEAGVRFGTDPEARFTAGVTFAYSRWKDVQADLISTDGFPYVTNIGSGYVRYGAVNLGWRPADGLDLELDGFLSTSHLDNPAPAFASSGESDLPNIADSGWRFSAAYAAMLGRADLKLDASVGYIGNSYLAIGQPFERTQGDYLDTSLGGRLGFGNWGLSLDIDNIFDSRANRFSFGNPFALEREDQRTPLRPRTIRIGVDAAF
jgi:outer membrane receptor protein involved in Fe transport